MIIDSHAHYNHNSFKNSFRYLTRNKNGYTIAEGDREAVIEKNTELKGITPGGSGKGHGRECNSIVRIAYYIMSFITMRKCK